MKPTYDDIRAEATPCLGGCGKLCTHGPRYCRECEAAEPDCDLSWTSHPTSCSHMRIWCRHCGLIGNTESLAALPPCPKARPDTEGASK